MKKIGVKKIALISLVLVLALGALGVGYAHWSDQLYINGDISAGSVTLAWTDEDVWADNEDVKDVGSAEIAFEDYVQDPCSGKDGWETMVLTVHNAYPQYEVYFTTLVVHNIGTIPVHITGFNIWDETGELNFEWIQPPGAPGITTYLGFFWKDFDGDGVFDDPDEEIINVKVVNFVCTQIHPCNETKGEIDLHFKQPMEECHTYNFNVEIEGVQWNEAP